MPLDSKFPESTDHVYDFLCPASREVYCMHDCGNKCGLLFQRNQQASLARTEAWIKVKWDMWCGRCSGANYEAFQLDITGNSLSS